MTSTRERQQRAAARARLAREMAERQEAAKRRRQRRAIMGAAVAMVLVLGGVGWAVAAMIGDEEEPAGALADAQTPDPTAAASAEAPAPPGECVWQEEQSEYVVDAGTPPPDEPREGTQVMTVTTNQGEIAVEMDLAQVPCVAASFTHLASEEFYDGSKCHRMFDGILQCGDPNARGEGYREDDGKGGPAYRFADQNLPAPTDNPPYPAGIVAMANSGPDTNGSQFFFIYDDLHLPPNYAIVGTITEGIDVLRDIGAAGHDGAFEPQPGGGHPNTEVVIESLRVSEPSA